MPELPEVHTIVSDLKDNIVGYKIARAWVAKDYPKISSQKEFIDAVTDKKIVGVRRIAKNILIELDGGDYIHIHLAMTGRVFLLEPSQKAGKRAHVVFYIKKGSDGKILTFSDTRMFGKIGLLSKEQFLRLNKKYGIDPLSEKADVNELYDSIKKSRAIIKNILMDQSIISGLGNIYATEALFLAKINPKTITKDISKEKFKDLFEAAKVVLKMGIKHRGSTLPDEAYVDIWGKPGRHQEHFNVYLKKVCPVCNTKVSYIKIGGRGTYFCPSCQPLN